MGRGQLWRRLHWVHGGRVHGRSIRSRSRRRSSYLLSALGWIVGGMAHVLLVAQVMGQKIEPPQQESRRDPPASNDDRLLFRVTIYQETPYEISGREIHNPDLLAMKSASLHAVKLFFEPEVALEVFGGKVPEELRELGPLVSQFDGRHQQLFGYYLRERIERGEPEPDQVAALLQFERNLSVHVEMVVRQHVTQEQSLRISQIGWWKTAFRETLYQVLVEGPVAEHLGVEQEARETLKEIALAEADLLRNEAHDIEGMVLDRCLSVLAPQRREQVEKRIGDRETARRLPAGEPEQLREQLRYSESLDRANREHGNRPSRETDQRLFLPGRFGVAVTEFVLMQDERVRKWLELDLEQEAEIEKQLEKYRELRRTIMPALANARRRGDSRQQRDELNLQFEADMADCEMQVVEVLRSGQREQLKELQASLEIRQRGLHRMLVGGSLGEEIGITESEKKRLFAMAPETERMVDERWRKAIDTHHERLVLALSSSQQRRFKATFGDPPKAEKVSDLENLARRLEYLVANLKIE